MVMKIPRLLILESLSPLLLMMMIVSGREIQVSEKVIRLQTELLNSKPGGLAQRTRALASAAFTAFLPLNKNGRTPIMTITSNNSHSISTNGPHTKSHIFITKGCICIHLQTTRFRRMPSAHPFLIEFPCFPLYFFF